MEIIRNSVEVQYIGEEKNATEEAWHQLMMRYA